MKKESVGFVLVVLSAFLIIGSFIGLLYFWSVGVIDVKVIESFEQSSKSVTVTLKDASTSMLNGAKSVESASATLITAGAVAKGAGIVEGVVGNVFNFFGAPKEQNQLATLGFQLERTGVDLQTNADDLRKFSGNLNSVSNNFDKTSKDISAFMRRTNFILSLLATGLLLVIIAMSFYALKKGLAMRKPFK